MHTRESLGKDLHRLGINAGDTVMVHASLRAIGEVAGGPDQVHLAIKDVLGEDGTMFMYASCPQYVDEVGRGNLTPDEEREVLEKMPPFDALTARSARDNGALVELFRTWPDTVVNHHPARFAVWGKQAEYLLSEQPWDFAFGEGSLLERFTKLDGRILLLGAHHDNTTYLHYAEHIADFPDKRIARFRVPVLEGGQRVWRDMAEVDSSKGAHDQWPDHFFERLVDDFLALTHNEGGKVGHATSHLIPARGLLEFALPVMERIARG